MVVEMNGVVHMLAPKLPEEEVLCPNLLGSPPGKSIRAASQVTGQGKRQLRRKLGADLKRGYQRQVGAATDLP